jgi:hypothetical protein
MAGRHQYEENQYPFNCLNIKQNKNLNDESADSAALELHFHKNA